ncbi:MAG TPA: DUF4402 domain-containing protein [Gemmatimonadaceae bacterium]|nr:DUF4402 domain-containing protein [Gemmatimonadaceae bacterium]
MPRLSLAVRAATAAAAVLTFTAAGASVAAAQTGTINATATVLEPITISGTSELQFGTVFPGVAKTIAVSDAGAGEFTVGGDGGAQVAVSFNLPTNLASGGNNLPIGSWAGYLNTTNSATSGGSTFTPSGTAFNANLSGTTGTAGSMFVFLGATVTPTITQVAGTYTNTVTMTVAYTGT